MRLKACFNRAKTRNTRSKIGLETLNVLSNIEIWWLRIFLKFTRTLRHGGK